MKFVVPSMGSTMKNFPVGANVDGVDDEELPRGRERLRRSLFADEMRVGHDLAQAHAQTLLDLLVVFRDEVRVSALGVHVELAAVGVLDELSASADEVADLCKFRFHNLFCFLLTPIKQFFI